MADKGKKKKGGKGFVYKATSPDRLKRQAEQTGSRFDGILKNGVELYKFKPGDNTFRILPPTWDNAEYYGLEVFVHAFVGANNGSYLCLAKMKNQKCPICDAAKEARDAGDKEEAAELSAKQRYLFWVIDRDDEGTGPKIADMSWSMDQAIAALCTHKRSGKVIAVDHPDDGRDITIQKRGQGINTKYYGHRIDSDPSPISNDEDTQDTILEQIRETPLPDILNYYTTDYLAGVMSGTAEKPDEEDEDEDEDEKPAKKKSGKKEEKKPSKKRRDDDDEDEDEDPPFDEDEDEKPSKKSSKKRRDDDDEDEDEDERPKKKSSKRSRDDDDEDEDEEEDEKPAKKSSKKRRDDDDEDEDEEEDEKPSKKSSKKRRDDDDEDEDEDERPKKKKRRDDDDEDDDDEDEKPAKKKSGKSSSRSRDDDDEDEDEEEEEEDERPAKKSSSKESSSSGGKSARARRFGR